MQITPLVDDGGRRSYLVADEQARQALIIDPLESRGERDLALLRARGLSLVVVAETHADPSGLSGAERLRRCTGASVIASDLGNACADTIVRQGDSFRVGRLEVHVVATPQRDADAISFRIGDHVFAAA